jgi:hypothetical protein
LLVVANSIDALRENFPASPARNNRSVLLVSDYPQPNLCVLLNDIAAPIAICADDFTTIAHWTVVSRNYGGVDTARFTTMGLVNVEPLISAPPRKSILVNDPRMSMTALLGGLAKLYKLSLSAVQSADILVSLGCAGPPPVTLGEYAAKTFPRNDAREILERRSPLENELIDFLAHQYDGIARGQRLERLEWPVYSLLRPEFPDRLTVGPIDLTGPARFIYHGPYFALPAGVWSADLTLEVSDCYAEDPIQIDVTAPHIIAAFQTKLPKSGVHGCQIRFKIEDPTRHIEIRLQLLTGAIEGVILLRRIVLHRLGSLDEDEIALT